MRPLGWEVGRGHGSRPVGLRRPRPVLQSTQMPVTLPRLNEQVAAASLVLARRRYPLLASSVALEINAILKGGQRRRGGPSFLLDAFGWDLDSSHERLALLEMCVRDFQGAGTTGAEGKLRDLGRADKRTWVSLYSELTIARGLELATGGRVLSFDPVSEGSRRADLLFSLAGAETLIEVCTPRPPADQEGLLDYPSRLMEALKRVDAGVELELLGCADLEADSELPEIQDAVKQYRREIPDAAVGDTIELGGVVSVQLIRRYPDARANGVGGVVTAVAIGNGPRLADKCREEARQLATGRPGVVIADLASQDAFSVDPWDAGLAEAAYALEVAPPSRGDAVIAVRSPITRTGAARFSRLALWQRGGAPQPLLDALAAGPVQRRSSREVGADPDRCVRGLKVPCVRPSCEVECAA